MKYTILLLTVFLLSGCGFMESDFQEYSDKAKTDMTKMCNDVGGTLATGLEITYTVWGTEITAGYYCINTKNPTGLVR